MSGFLDDTPPAQLTVEQLRERVTGFAGQITALTARFLELLGELDERGGWGGEGISSCAHWLAWRTGMSIRTAQEHVRVARALPGLPLLREEFATGRLTYSKARALTRVATPEREAELVNFARSASATQVEKLVRSMRHLDRETAEREAGHIESSGQWKWHLDGTLSVTLRLNPLDGARLLAGAVRAEYERTRVAGDGDVPRDALKPPTELVDPAAAGEMTAAQQRDLWRHVPHNIAPAMVAMADTVHGVVDIPEIAPGAEIVVHTFADNNSEGDGDAALSDPHLDGGPALAEIEVDEAQCGAAEREVTKNKRGAVLSWGRKRRQPTAAMIRAIFNRDAGCAHPGCGRTRHLHAHHVRDWDRHDGPTDMDNLIMLCSTHHRALHRGRFAIRALGDQQFSFHRTDGSLIETAPAVAIPDDWEPDPQIAPDATATVGGGRLDLGYTTEVLYAIWRLKAEQPAAA
ncbi:hypothetical protein GORHZ_113_00230 [Gordonia rhizosphera NBRC 16068]|uniref:HNH nuclease domain-containing protein n=1 Tax=Gordonia rhizosphera NBRC 16068 TaxID=1108045 RepID=K6WEN1_9ACTN|nr:HNH endonuclease signature motif containing protein [Gordonia rhizosphera]GAB90642.1 hypothetical protein GORHZ_113_00230 [Gordonia rhizosphera NBRC 16068]